VPLPSAVDDDRPTRACCTAPEAAASTAAAAVLPATSNKTLDASWVLAAALWCIVLVLPTFCEAL
jgi:hypothetical protein